MVRSALPAAAAACVLALLAACSSDAPRPSPPSQPVFYRSLASSSASVDPATAAEMISAYRANKGLPPLTVDPELIQSAQAAANAMARADRPASGEALSKQLATRGLSSPGVNLSAGYHTLAEAFSGWRDSPANNRVMLLPRATRLGIATAYAPGSKYKVYWALIVAGPR
ncbi:MAG: CAP domain-containing protein [Chelatococcus sp.]|uniref:CAP domain-containing protein n=1 Tax=Chelatococcus sp. TaxID=1953771 RepID=UPI0025C6B5EA|nr:CAP domain-containing protein [Chelatococcus sp.]MBX3536693.1 CAP domain-containing protein [Chelatococcus sp.]